MAKEAPALNKWSVLILNTAVFLGIVGIPYTAMPVFFSGIIDELNLTLLQIGVIWGFFFLGMAFGSFLGGLAGDRFGLYKVIGILCFAVALTNGLRALSADYISLTISMSLCGFAIGAAIPNVNRTPGLYFPPDQLGMAVGITSSGFSLGAVLSTALGATFILPLAGSWRNVLFIYSALCAVLGIAWLCLMRGTGPNQNIANTETSEKRVPFHEALGVIFRSKDMWLILIMNVTLMGSFASIVGYLPTYLIDTGLPNNIGDPISSTLFLAGIAGALLIPLISDKIGRRKALISICAVIMGAGTCLLTISNTAFLWLLVPAIGFAYMGVVALCYTIILEMKEIGPAYGATALGLAVTSQNIGGFFLPIIGGSLAVRNIAWPFLFWAAAIFGAAICLFRVKETGGSRN
ncbi:MAG: MFS transporter [Dehalococcoidia bacterium]|nr:MFS transporter [Dehalococcoidia bacterium]